MPHKQEIEFIPLHPTFAAEVKGVDFSQPIPDDTFTQIQAGIAKARTLTSLPALSLRDTYSIC